MEVWDSSSFTTISSPRTGPSPRMITNALTDPGGGGVLSGIKRKKKRGRPFKKRPPRNPLGGQRKVKQPDSEATPAPPSPSTAGIKRPRGRPRKDQQPSQTTTNSLDLTLATLSDDAVSMRTKRLIARQTKETPPAAMLAPKTGIKRGRGRPRKDKSATPMSAQTGGAMSTGIKRGRGRPRKDKPAAAMPAETGGAVSRRNKSRSRRPRKIKSRGGRPRQDKPAAAMSAETGGAVSTGTKRRRGRPRKKSPSTAMSAEAGDAASTELMVGCLQPEMQKSTTAMSGKTEDAASAEAAGGMFGDMAWNNQESSSGDHRRTEHVERQSGVGSQPLPGETDQHLGDAEMEVNSGNEDNTQADPPYLEPQTVAPGPSEASLQISKQVEAAANLVMQSAQPVVAPTQLLQREAEQVNCSDRTPAQTLQPEMHPPASREAYTQTDLIIQSAQPSTVPTGLSQRDAEQASLSRVPSSQCLSSAMHSSVPPSSILLERAHPDQCQPPSHQPEAAPGSSPQIFPVTPIMFNHPPVGDDPLEK